MKDLTLTRRSLLLNITIGVAAIGAQWLLTGCGSGGGYGGGGAGGSGGATTGGDCAADGSMLETTGVTEGHSHMLQLTAAEILAANPNAVFTTSSVGHTHNVQLTAQQYADLQANIGVSLVTEGATTDGHTHTLTINCA